MCLQWSWPVEGFKDIFSCDWQAVVPKSITHFKISCDCINEIGCKYVTCFGRLLGDLSSLLSTSSYEISHQYSFVSNRHLIIPRKKTQTWTQLPTEHLTKDEHKHAKSLLCSLKSSTAADFKWNLYLNQPEFHYFRSRKSRTLSSQHGLHLPEQSMDMDTYYRVTGLFRPPMHTPELDLSHPSSYTISHCRG
jgi:hypothetical protein